MNYDVIVVGGGPAGLAAACSASEAGARKILILERDTELGGILNQCIHSGFGLHYFGEELTGPEYADRFEQMLSRTAVEVRTDTMVLSLEPDREVHSMNRDGYHVDKGRTVILAMGCRERTRGAIGIPGTRPAGVLTAGTAQRYLNIQGYRVGNRVVILGSGDIGLIMARRLKLTGAEVLACIELMPHSSGLTRNIVQCLDDFDIPLYLSHTVTEIEGRDRITGVTVAEVDADRRPVPGTQKHFACDTLLLSVGLIPENELSRAAGMEMDPRTGGPVVYENMETTLPGFFACGNVVQVHDLVDYVTLESQRAGQSAADWKEADPACRETVLEAGEHVTYTVPQRLRDRSKKVEVSFRVDAPLKEGRVLVEDTAGNTVARFRREHLTPGEMQHITLPPKLLAGAEGDILRIRVEETVCGN